MKSLQRRGPIVIGALSLSIALLILLRPGGETDVVGQGKTKAETKMGPAEQAIRQANTAYVEALTKGDLDAIMAFWDDDADYIDETGKPTKGKEAIKALFAKILPSLKGTKVNGYIQSVKLLRPELALEDGTIEYVYSDGVKDSNRHAVVWTKSGDKWLISNVRDLPAEIVDLPSIASAQLKSLEWLIGEWQDDSDKKDIVVRVSWAPNKAFLLLDYVIKQDEGEPLQVNMRLGWDGVGRRIRSWMFDSQGGFAEGYWQKDGNKWLVGVTGILPDGGVGGATNTYEFVNANSFVWRATDRDVDGQPLADAEVKFVRAAKK